MKKLSIIAFLFVLSLVMLFPDKPAMAATTPNLDNLDKFIQQSLKDYGVPGAAVAVVQDGKVVFAKGYGVRDLETNAPVDENTIFQLASVTKSFTGAAAATQVDDGKLDWDTPIFNYLPEFVGYDPYMTAHLTERDLMAMRTGWPQFTGDIIDQFGYDRAEVLHRLRYLKPAYSLREVSQYSNPGIFVAGEVAARVGNTTWNDLVQDKLLTPLDMTRTGTQSAVMSDTNTTKNYAMIDGKVQETTRNVLDTTGAASSMTSTASDMAHFMEMLLNKGTYDGKPILKPESVQEMYNRSMIGEVSFSELPPISDSTGFYYGLGVDSYDYAGHHIIEKAGALSGVRTVFTLIPDMNAGIVVLSNMNLLPFPEAVRAYYVNDLLGFDPQTDQDKIKAAVKVINQLVVPPTPPANPQPFAGDVKGLLGTYTNDYYGPCDIIADGDSMKVQCGPAKYTATLTHWDNGQFMMLFPGSTSGYDPITFNIGADGKAESFTSESFGVMTRVTPSQP